MNVVSVTTTFCFYIIALQIYVFLTDIIWLCPKWKVSWHDPEQEEPDWRPSANAEGAKGS